MAKEVKNKWFGGRVDDAMEAEIKAYVAASKMSEGELARRGALEYMANHPIKDPAAKVDTTKIRKPGE